MAADNVTVSEPTEYKGKGGTFPLADVAEIRMRGGDIPAPGSEAEEIVLAAWAAYRYIRAQAQRSGKEAVRFAKPGWELEIEIPEVFRAVWPAGQSPLPVAGTDHDEARRMLTVWLGTHRNLSNVARGNPDMRATRATVAAKPSKWWVAAEFSGAPAGMRLPDTSVVTGELPPAQLVTEQEATASGRDWWCPHNHLCGLGTPVTEEEMTRHFVERHGARRNSFLLDSFMEDARRLHGTPQPVPEPEPEPGTLTSLVQPSARTPEKTEPAAVPPPAPVTAPAPARTRTRTLSGPLPGGQVSAQARVFIGEIAALEDEIARLRRENAELRKRLAERDGTPQAVTLTAASADDLSRRIARLVNSEHELS